MKKPIVLSAIYFSLLFFSTFSFAAGPVDYLIFKGGIFSPQSGDLQGFNDGLSIEFAFRRYFTHMFAIELGAGYISADGPGSRLHSVKNLWAVPVTGTLKVFIPIGRAVEVYGGPGGGVYFATAETNLHASHGCAHDDVAVGWHAVAGLDFRLSERAFLGIEARYLWVEAHFENGDDIDADFDGFTAMATLGFRF